MERFLVLSGSTLFAFAEPEHGGGGGHHGPSWLGLIVYAAFVVVVLALIIANAKKGFTNRVFSNPMAKLSEQLYLFIENMCVGVIGAHGRKYIPMIMTFWLVIFISNSIALFFPTSPTADLSFNLGLALIAIGYVQWEGIRSNGFFGHFSHFAGPKLGYALIPISIIIFVIEIISEVMKNVSLSLRLYGNIEGGHKAADAISALGHNFLGLPIDVPFGALLLVVKLLTVIVQALIFCLLTCVYISLVTHHDEEHHDEGGHGAEPALAGGH